MEFEKRKAKALSSITKTTPDKSPKGTLDTPILPLLSLLNSHSNYYTTSSCSGRISILSQPKKTTNKKKARGGSWLFISHSPVPDPTTVLSLLFPESIPLHPECDEEIVFRFEPLIVAVECRDVEAARVLVGLAIGSGFRESGITSVGGKGRVIVGIRCSIRMEVPLGERGRVLVSPEYVRFLVEVANGKMEANWKRMDGFCLSLEANGFARDRIVGNGFVRAGIEESGWDGFDGGDDFESVDVDGLDGLERLAGCSLSVVKIVVGSEPVDRLFLWGHSASTVDHNGRDEILVFGGFGGIGRHARRNDCLMLDPLNGSLEEIAIVECAPCPRLGHTASLVGNSMFVIGGRADPLNILGDVWVLNTVTNKWRLLEPPGSSFPSRHRHSSAVIGSNIYVFGGLNNDTIFSSMYVFYTENQQWKELSVSGEQPCARHSQSMVACGSRLFMFGGCNGEKALGDLYSFDTHEEMWKKENVAGRSPCARFSHSMFVYKNYLGVIGGCPVSQHFQELALLDLRVNSWKYVTLDSIGKELLVRSTASVSGDDLIMIGGGAACYAFGTKFSEPFKINLFQFMSLEDTIAALEIDVKSGVDHHDGVRAEKVADMIELQVENGYTFIPSPEAKSKADTHQIVVLHWVLQLEKKYAKIGKDILKKFGWLDPGRKVYSQENGSHICFPVTEKFSAQYGVELEGTKNNFSHESSMPDGNSLNDLSYSTALNILNQCGATKLEDKFVEARKTAKSPLQIMIEAIGSLIRRRGLLEKLLEELPSRWERLGDIVVLPMTSFMDPVWNSMGEELWPLVAGSLNCHRLARQGRVAPTGTRDSCLEILMGDNGWVDHRENGILYSFDATKCMFSWGNLSEKLRMARMDCANEIVVDLFAGIGYFVLPLLVGAKAKYVYACEWNPHAIEALKHNLEANSVSDRCVVLAGDNWAVAPKGVADRVCLGLLPTSEGSWITAVQALRNEGGILHVHGNVKDTEEDSWSEHVSQSISDIAKSEGHSWEVLVEHVERVKWYAPHIRHLVADVRCRPV